jgi:hypothetical protein
MTQPQPHSAHANERAESEQAWRDRGRTWLRGFMSLKWVPMAGALLALPLSAAALWVSLQQPDVMLILPDQVRVAQGRESGSAYVYLQPAFVSTGANNRVEVIRDMTLSVSGPAQAEFEWTQQLRLVGSADSTGLSYEYAGDAAPLLISSGAAATPLSLFDAPPGWHFVPGTYRFTLRAERVVVSAPIEQTFTVTLSAENIDFLEQTGPEQFLTFRVSGSE